MMTCRFDGSNGAVDVSCVHLLERGHGDVGIMKLDGGSFRCS